MTTKTNTTATKTTPVEITDTCNERNSHTNNHKTKSDEETNAKQYKLDTHAEEETNYDT